MVVLATLVAAGTAKAGLEAAGVLAASVTAYKLKVDRDRKIREQKEEEQKAADNEQSLSIDTPVDTGLNDDVEAWLPGAAMRPPIDSRPPLDSSNVKSRPDLSHYRRSLHRSGLMNCYCNTTVLPPCFFLSFSPIPFLPLLLFSDY